MITCKDSRYQDLFLAASAYLNSVEPAITGAPNINITALDQYFHYIKELSVAPGHPEFMRLPIGEPLFTIDLDTREVVIPTEFSNGISVRGDQIAENIWFSVDRFFDQKDLLPTASNNLHIVVQWTNANGEKGLSETLWHDYKNDNGRTLLFCWPITDAITKAAGTVQFSVRFYETKVNDATSIIYNLNTQICSVNILDTLDAQDVNDTTLYTLNKQAEIHIIEALQNTSCYGGFEAEYPIIVEPTVPATNAEQKSDAINISATETVQFDYDATTGVYTISELPTQTDSIDYYVALNTSAISDADDFNYLKSIYTNIYVYANSQFIAQDTYPTSGSPVFYVKKSTNKYTKLYVTAKSTDAGTVNYFWEDPSSVRDTALENNAEYLLTNDTAVDTSTVYYQKNGNAYDVWVKGASTEFPDGDVYERYGSRKVGVADTYYGLASNEIEGSIVKLRPANGKKFIVVGPTAPIVTANEASRKVAITYHADSSLNVYSTSEVNVENQTGYINLKAYLDKTTKTVQDHVYTCENGVWTEVTDVTTWDHTKNYYRKYAELEVSATSSNAADTLTCNWTLNIPVEGYGDVHRHVTVEDPANPVTIGTDHKASLIVETANSLTDTEERYYADVTSSRNNGEITVSSEAYRVSDLPVAPSLKGDYLTMGTGNRAVWYTEAADGNVVVTEGNKNATGEAREDFIYHSAASYVRVKGQLLVPMYFKVIPSVGTAANDDYYYEWHMLTSSGDITLNDTQTVAANRKSGMGSGYATCYFPVPDDDLTTGTITNQDIIGTDIYCKVWNVVNGVGRPDASNQNFPTYDTTKSGKPVDGEDKVYENIYGNESISALFTVSA